MAFLTTLMGKPRRKISFHPGPSLFGSCLTDEFIKTVQREPKSTGYWEKRAALGKIGDAVAHGLGEGLDKGTAAGGAGLVEHNAVDGVVFHLEALDVLAADVQNKVHLGIKMPGRLEVGHGLNDAGVHLKGALNEPLP